MTSSMGRDTNILLLPSLQEQMLRDIILIKDNSYSKNAMIVLLVYCILLF